MLDTDDISTSVAEDNGTAPTDVYDRIAQLAKLAAIPYQLERKKAAKTMGLTVTALDSAVAQKRRDYYAGETHPDALWHTPEGEPWATIGGWHFPVRSSQFRSWLTGRLFQTTGEVSRVQVDQLVEVYAAEAVGAGPEHPVHLRSAKCDGAIWLDLADEKGRAVRIDADGWRVVEAAEVPVKFRRPPNLRPLPEPLRDEADVSLLALLLNVGDPADWRLVAVWLSNALLPDVAYPILAESGKPGAAKTTAAMGLRQLIDPNAVPLCDTPRNRDDLKAHAKNNAMIAYDNLSGMPGWLADDLCRVATGGGLGGRRLYTDDDDAGFNVKRPVIINGVNDLATRGDLADRAVLLTLEAIPDAERRTDAEMDEAFQYAQLRILAGLVDMVAMGLRRREAVAKQRRPLPRMADFALWG